MLAIKAAVRNPPEIIKYVIAGGTAFLVDFTILYLCSEYLGLHYLLGNLFGYGGGLLTSYLLNIRWVFSYRKFGAGTEFALFNVIVLLGLGLSELLMYLFVEQGGTHYLYAKVGASAVVFTFNYITKKLFLFSPAAAPEGASQ